MATILELFRNQKKDIYGTLGTVFIDSAGLINPPRGAALAAASLNANADLVGGQVAGLIGGFANRPSDTIFKNNTPTSKPVILNPLIGIRNAVESGEKYYVKQSPSPELLFPNLKQGASSLSSRILNIGRQQAPTVIDKIKEKLNKTGENDKPTTIFATNKEFEYYKPEKFEDIHSNQSKGVLQSYTTHVRNSDGKLEKRNASNQIYSNGKGKFDQINSTIQLKPFFDKNLKFEELIKTEDFKSEANQTVLIFEPYGKDYSIVLPASVTGISEDINPEWETYKFLGSPFNSYKYKGFERSIKFEFKLYYNTYDEKLVMINKVNSIKEFAFPNDELTAIQFKNTNGNESDYTQLSFGPNFVYLTIGGLYKRMLGAVDSLSFSVEDNAVWPNDPNNSNDEPYPSIINVSFSMKVIENHTIKKGKTSTRFAYNMDGSGDGVGNKKGIGTIGTAKDEGTYK